MAAMLKTEYAKMRLMVPGAVSIWFNRPRNLNEPDPDWFDQTTKWKAPEIHLDDGRILVLEYT